MMYEMSQWHLRNESLAHIKVSLWHVWSESMPYMYEKS